MCVCVCVCGVFFFVRLQTVYFVVEIYHGDIIIFYFEFLFFGLCVCKVFSLNYLP